MGRRWSVRRRRVPGGATDADRADVTAILGTVSRLGAADASGLTVAGTSGATSALAWPPESAVLAFSDGGAAPVLRRGIKLTNPGPMPAVLGAASIVGPDAARFRIEQGCAQGLMLVAQTECEMIITYSPSLKPLVEAVLQVRSDQGNPASIRLVGRAATAPATLPESLAPLGADSGGGCSVGPPGRKAADPTLAVAALLAALASVRRWRPRRPGTRYVAAPLCRARCT